MRSEQELAKFAKARAETDRQMGLKGGLLDFITMAWHLVEPENEFQPNWHIEEICAHLEAVSRGEIRNLVINVPPGCMKSFTCQVFWQPWEWLTKPSTHWAGASFDQGLTYRDARKSLAIMLSDWYRKRWGDIVQLPEGEPAVGEFFNLRGGSRFSTSVKGKLTGRHFDRIIIDDPIKPMDLSPTSIDNVERWWTSTVPTRVRPNTGARIIIMQRLHERDLAGLVLKDGDFVHLRLPMRYESKFPCKTSWGGDRRTQEGEILWPSRFNEAEVQSRAKSLKNNVAPQEQQRPVPEGGKIFKKAWHRHWTVSQVVQIAGTHVRTVPEKFDLVVLSLDATFKDAATSDFVVAQIWGKRGPDYFLLDQVRDQMDFGRTCDEVETLCKRWPDAHTLLIEDKANGSAIISTLRKKRSGVVPINPEGGKAARAQAVAPLFEAGNVWDPDPGVTPWVEETRDERTSFPFGAYDDTVDATSQALNWMQTRGTNFDSAMDEYAEMERRGVKLFS